MWFFSLLGWCIAIGIVVLVLYIMYRALCLVMDFTYSLQEWIFNSDDPILGRMLAFPLWLPLGLFRAILLLLGIIAAASLVKDAQEWWRK